MADRPNYRDEIAGEIISRIEAGTAPWQKPWRAGAIGSAPFNPVSGNPYRGINDLWLSLQGRGDPRWMTFQQAAEQSARVRKGEKATTIEYWQWTERQALTDADGKPVLDGDGQQRTQTVRLERPRVFYAKVFNAEQIEGLAPFVPSPAPAEPVIVARAETMIASAGVPVLHDQADRAFYALGRDEIHLPARAAFTSSAAYYETALHELGHATGHPGRLNRQFGPFGSQGYAREELRAEIASYMLARDLGISFDPSNHASYVESWLKALREDRNEIFRAAKDAEIIKTWVMEPERRPELDQAARHQRAASVNIEGVETASKNPLSAQAAQQATSTVARTEEPTMNEKRYIAVPFGEKDEAKAAGARWDRTVKSWYITESQDPALFSKWSAPATVPAPALSPTEEFAEALKAHGLIVKGAPDMDGEWHRVPVVDDKGKAKSGVYRGFLDGRAAGNITNYKSGAINVKWVAVGVALTAEEKASIQAQAAQVRADREAARLEAADKAARTAFGIWVNLPGEADPLNCRYLAAKGVYGYGVKATAEGQMVVPCRTADGKLWNVQFVGEDKHFLKDSRKIGTMHVVEPTGKGTLSTLDNDLYGPVLIAEGYATAARIFEATGEPVVVAFDSGNLMAVAEAVKARFPDRHILVCADNDHANVHGNVGMVKAEEAAKAVGGSFIAPIFSSAEKAKGLTDFDDLGKARGSQSVSQAINSALAHIRAQEPERGIA